MLSLPDWPSQLRHTALCASCECSARNSSLSEGNIRAASNTIPAVHKIQDLWSPTIYSVTLMIDCRSVDEVRGGGGNWCFVRIGRSRFKYPHVWSVSWVFPSLLYRDPNGANEPEVVRFVYILWLVSQFVVFIFYRPMYSDTSANEWPC